MSVVFKMASEGLSGVPLNIDENFRILCVFVIIFIDFLLSSLHSTLYSLSY
jgi:hypothetical protein